MRSDDVNEVETVYGRLLFAFRKECTENGPGSTLAQEISTAIIVLEKLWPDDTTRYADRFK